MAKKETVVEKIKKEAKAIVKKVEKAEEKAEVKVAEAVEAVERKIEGKPEAKKGSKEVEIGEISHYFDKISVAAIKLSKPMKVGDKIRIKGGEVDFVQAVHSMQINGKSVDKAKKGDEVGIKVDQRANKGYRVLAA